MMETVRRTMQSFYCNPEDRAIVSTVSERAQEEAWDGICTTGFRWIIKLKIIKAKRQLLTRKISAETTTFFSIDGVPMRQPQLTPIIPEDFGLILTRLPVHSKLDVNNNVPSWCPKFRMTYTVFGETIHGFGNNKDEAKRDGCLKLAYMFQDKFWLLLLIFI